MRVKQHFELDVKVDGKPAVMFVKFVGGSQQVIIEVDDKESGESLLATCEMPTCESMNIVHLIQQANERSYGYAVAGQREVPDAAPREPF